MSMDILQAGIATYHANKALIGIDVEGKSMLAPIAHQPANVAIEITLDASGNYISARKVDKTEPKRMIPVTLDSAVRTSHPKPHPLCDTLQYIAPTDPNYHEPYMDQLKDWAESQYSHPIVVAVLRYVERGTVLNDLAQSDVITLKADGSASDYKAMVSWRVTGLSGSDGGASWLNKALFDIHVQRQMDWIDKNLPKGYDMITGKVCAIAEIQPKGLIAACYSAKLISSNDDQGLTYRGRTDTAKQALSIGYVPSQQAHAALAWVVANAGKIYGRKKYKAIVAWDPSGGDMPSPIGVFARWDKDGSPEDAEQPVAPATMDDYKAKLRHTLMGWVNQFAPNERCCIAQIEQTAPGRLSSVYFADSPANDYVTRLADWDLWCTWIHPIYGVTPPLIPQIINYAKGARGGKTFDCAEGAYEKELERLLDCRLNGTPLPLDIVRALCARASRLELYDDEAHVNREASYLRTKILHTACACLRKHRHDAYGEVYDVDVDPNLANRSYQYGRLLAVYDKIEERVLYKLDRHRTTNAIRSQTQFRSTPLRVARALEHKIRLAYLPRLDYRAQGHYKRILADVWDGLREFPEAELQRPLDDTYLLGYSAQRHAMRYKPNGKGKADGSSAENIKDGEDGGN